MKLVVTSVTYGYTYTDIFLNQSLKALLDPTNIPKFKDSIEFVIFSDNDWAPEIIKHENYKRLEQLVPTCVEKVSWPKTIKGDDDKYNFRYSRLLETLKDSIRAGLAKDAYVMALCADLIPAQEFIPKVVAKLDDGYDAVFIQPARAAAEATIPKLNSYFRAFPSEPLFKIAYDNMSPLWTHSHWEATQFTNGPYTLIWNSGTGLLVRSFSVTPVIFKPNKEMLEIEHTIDIGLPQYCKNPYRCENWDDAPIIEIAPLSCHYPTFLNHMSSRKFMRWFKEEKTIPSQWDNLKQHMYYPNKKVCNLDQTMLNQSDQEVRILLNETT